VLAVFEQSGLTTRETSVSSGLVPQLVRNAMAADAKKATDKFQQGANSGLIVQLTPETMERLERGRPVYDKVGNLLASVRNEKGHLSPMHLDKADAQVAAASNMATLAVTAALSQQLEAISEQLQEMSETLEGMVKDRDRERLSDALAANEILFELAESVRRRGVTQADYMQLASLKHRVTSL
jgi:chaperonin cofactor prefoldin